jgi:hypothetical protein
LNGDATERGPDESPQGGSSRRFLDPVERITEALFGLIMVLTFTCSISAAEAGREDVRTMIFGALGCNLAWAIIDALIYLMSRLSARGRELIALRGVRGAEDPRVGREILAAALPSAVASVLEPEELERVRERLGRMPEPPRGARFGRSDWLGALGVFLWVLLITFPVVVPFLVIQAPVRALRVSNSIAIGLLFFAGFAYGRWSGLQPWRTGAVMVVVGTLLVAVTIALGG